MDCFVAFISTPTILLCLEIVSNLLCVVMQICLPRSIAQFVGKFLIPPKSSFCFVESLKFVDMGGRLVQRSVECLLEASKRDGASNMEEFVFNVNIFEVYKTHDFSQAPKNGHELAY